MRSWQVPCRGVGRRIGAGAEMDACLEFGKRLGDFQISRCVVNRVGWGENDQSINHCGVDIRLESCQITEALRPRLHGGERLTFADISERQIDRKGQLMDLQRLPRSRKND